MSDFSFDLAIYNSLLSRGLRALRELGSPGVQLLHEVM